MSGNESTSSPDYLHPESKTYSVIYIPNGFEASYGGQDSIIRLVGYEPSESFIKNLFL